MCVRARVVASPSDRVRLLVLPYGGNFRSAFRLGLDHVSSPGPVEGGENKKKREKKKLKSTPSPAKRDVEKTRICRLACLFCCISPNTRRVTLTHHGRPKDLTRQMQVHKYSQCIKIHRYMSSGQCGHPDRPANLHKLSSLTRKYIQAFRTVLRRTWSPYNSNRETL